ncbi:cell division protein FtsL [Pigmentiphaga litoralis]|uniref:Cell division protein FtsL n=1 Tax=Pigmentiphaga litoralis TaxID=516702 RepID=A0A7Y9IXA3_9BURK|nr:cell division protein FtsL [Pigmentiphaga litoralis]NYE25667.1 cell division protein FtsL [Pigmentiphaga litoralis]NYE84787.1 cell division protein FtsL [Pigmentiphaga litoralis]
MARLLFVLTLALIGCALSLVSSQYEARSLFMELERAQVVTRDLDVDWRRLQLEQTDHSKHGLIDNVARNTLKMEPVTPARTIYLAQRRDQGDAPVVLPFGPLGEPMPAPAGRNPSGARR